MVKEQTTLLTLSKATYSPFCISLLIALLGGIVIIIEWCAANRYDPQYETALFPWTLILGGTVGMFLVGNYLREPLRKRDITIRTLMFLLLIGVFLPLLILLFLGFLFHQASSLLIHSSFTWIVLVYLLLFIICLERSLYTSKVIQKIYRIEIRLGKALYATFQVLDTSFFDWLPLKVSKKKFLDYSMISVVPYYLQDSLRETLF